MKARITFRDARQLGAYCIGYCEAQNLLRFEEPIFYTANQYGRRADYYKVENPNNGEIARVSTGYGPTGKKYIDYERLKNYEEKEQALDTLMKSGGSNYRERKLAHRRLFFDMLQDETTN